MKQLPDLEPIVPGVVDGDDDPVELAPARKRGRRGPALATAVTALVLLAAGMAALGSDDDGSEVRSSTRVTAPARDWDGECDNDGDSRGATAAELPPQLLYFPGYVPAGLSLRNAGGSIWPDHLGCHHGSVALVLGEADGGDPDRLARSVQVSGPSFQPRPESFGGPAGTAVKVRRADGVWLTPFGDDSDGRLLWADPEGGEWTMIGARDLVEALAIADGLRIDLDVDGPPVVAEDLPDDIEVLWERPEQEGAGYDSDTSWALTFYGPGGPQDPTLAYTPPPSATGSSDEPAAPPIEPYSGPALSIGIERMSTPATAFAQYGEATRIEIRDLPALFITDPNGSSWITWDEEYGVTVRVSGSVGFAELRKVAESLRPVTPDDPRLSDTRN